MAAPANSSGWVWKFGKYWSDQIAMSGCTDDFTVGDGSSPQCGSREVDDVRYYYYNMPYVENNNPCTGDWRLPVFNDIAVLNANTTKEHIWAVWGKNGRYDQYGTFSADMTDFWTSTPFAADDALITIVYVGAWGIESAGQYPTSGHQVRCVKD